MILPQSFYRNPTPSVARNILGCHLLHRQEEGITGGRIVETEGYLFRDPAARSFPGKTEKNATLFGPPGHAYVYLVYGLHLLFNIVTGEDNPGEAVLIRALEPCEGIPVMEARRGTRDVQQLCRGPGNLTKALGITRACNGYPLYSGNALTVISADGLSGYTPVAPADIVQTTRVGLHTAKSRPLRLYIKGNEYVSRV